MTLLTAFDNGQSDGYGNNDTMKTTVVTPLFVSSFGSSSIKTDETEVAKTLASMLPSSPMLASVSSSTPPTTTSASLVSPVSPSSSTTPTVITAGAAAATNSQSMDPTQSYPSIDSVGRKRRSFVQKQTTMRTKFKKPKVYHDYDNNQSLYCTMRQHYQQQQQQQICRSRQNTTKKNKNVTFHPIVVQFDSSTTHTTLQERKERWYSKTDLKVLKQTAVRLTLYTSATLGVEHIPRGMEGCTVQRLQYKKASIRCVLMAYKKAVDKQRNVRSGGGGGGRSTMNEDLQLQQQLQQQQQQDEEIERYVSHVSQKLSKWNTDLALIQAHRDYYELYDPLLLLDAPKLDSVGPPPRISLKSKKKNKNMKKQQHQYQPDSDRATLTKTTTSYNDNNTLIDNTERIGTHHHDRHDHHQFNNDGIFVQQEGRQQLCCTEGPPSA